MYSLLGKSQQGKASAPLACQGVGIMWLKRDQSTRRDLDFQKDFDKVLHQKLLRNWTAIVLSWTESLLEEKEQRAAFKVHFSDGISHWVLQELVLVNFISNLEKGMLREIPNKCKVWHTLFICHFITTMLSIRDFYFCISVILSGGQAIDEVKQYQWSCIFYCIIFGRAESGRRRSSMSQQINPLNQTGKRIWYVMSLRRSSLFPFH